MKGYKFRLQKLLDIRLDKEEQCKREFREVQHEKNIIENKLENLEDSYNKYNVIKTDETTIQRKMKNMYLVAMEHSINDTKIDLNKKVTEVDKKREELKNKQVERKTVEILKEKDSFNFKKQQDLIEQKNNDEFALYGFIRRKSS